MIFFLFTFTLSEKKYKRNFKKDKFPASSSFYPHKTHPKVCIFLSLLKTFFLFTNKCVRFHQICGFERHTHMRFIQSLIEFSRNIVLIMMLHNMSRLRIINVFYLYLYGEFCCWHWFEVLLPSSSPHVWNDWCHWQKRKKKNLSHVSLFAHSKKKEDEKGGVALS